MKYLRAFSSVLIFVLTIVCMESLPAQARKDAGPKWQALIEEADGLLGRGDFERALAIGERALELAEKAVGPDHIDVARSLHNVASCHAALGRLAEAEPLFKRALVIEEKAVGPDSP